MRVLIVDDEPLARERLRRLLAAHPQFEYVGEARDGTEALEKDTELTPDLILLDIDMPGMSGLEVAERLREKPLPPAVIFVTAHPEHALAAYRSGPADYLVKPVTPARLAEALARLGTTTRAHREKQTDEQTWVHVQLAGTHRRIPFADVFYFMAEDKYVKVRYEGGEALLDTSLKQLEEHYGQLVLRVHRNTLINRSRLAGLSCLGNGHYLVELTGTTERVEASRRLARQVREALGT